NCCVAMHSGWGAYVADAAKFTGKDASGVFHFPGVGPEATEWLLKQRQVAGIAVDTISLDHGPSKDFKTHLLWLPAGHWGLEGVANLDKVPASGATLVVGLAKVRGATGGPPRLIALGGMDGPRLASRGSSRDHRGWFSRRRRSREPGASRISFRPSGNGSSW